MTRTNTAHHHTAVVFHDREHAEAAVDDLRSSGLGSEHLRVAVHHGDPVVFEDDADAAMARDTRRCAAIGAPIGFVVGFGVVAIAVSDVGLGGMLAVGAAGALWGGFLGCVAGLGRSNRITSEHEQIEYRRLTDGEVLVVLCHDEPGSAARDVLLRHEGRLGEVAPG